MKFKLAVCDDNQTDREYIKKFVLSWGENRKHNIFIKEFQSAEAFLFEYEDVKDYDILLLDINMARINGMDLAKRIREDNQYVQIIFITGYPDYISEGYEVSATHYLMKPVEKEKMFNTLDRAVKNISKTERTLLFSIGNTQKRVSADSIVYVESFYHNIKVVTVAEAFEVKMTMYDMEKMLGEGFVRCHRSYVVGIKHISSINTSEIVLDSGIKLPLSRSAQNTVRNDFIHYYKEGLQ